MRMTIGRHCVFRPTHDLLILGYLVHFRNSFNSGSITDVAALRICAKIRHGQDSALYFLHRKSSFRSAGFQYTHGNALSVEGSFSFKDANLPLPNLVELQGDMLS
jgi:hypothetical protein